MEDGVSSRMTGQPECLDWGKDKRHLSFFFSLMSGVGVREMTSTGEQ